jgi:hypothetical protein
MRNINRQNKYLFLSQLLWKRRVNRKYMPHAGYMGSGGDIHLMLGVNGTGINHMAQLLSQALPNNHYVHNPLVRFEPKLTLSNQGDRLAIPYHKTLAADHPLNRIYRIYAERFLLTDNVNIWEMESAATQADMLIMKESNSLLATESLLRELKCHVLFYVSDPVILAEQIFLREGLDTPYLDLESEAVVDFHFLKRFLSNDIRAVLHAYKLLQRLSSGRQRRVQKKIFTIALIQHMFHKLAVRYPELATIVDFAQIQNDPKCLEYPLVNWLGPNRIEDSKRVLSMATFTPNGHKFRRWTRSWPESITTFEMLSSEDVKMAYQLITDHKLMGDEGQIKTWVEKSAV